MKKLLLILLGLSLCLVLSAKQKKAVLVIVDGIPNDVVEHLHIPSVFDIASHGAYGKSYVGGEIGTYTESPTISAVCYNIILTGTWACKNNVWGNSNMKPNHSYWSIPRIAKENGKSVGVFTSWTDNRIILLGDITPDYWADGYDLDKERFPNKKNGLQIFDYDEMVSQEAAKCIRENAPDFSWVYLWYTDHAGHSHGNSDFFYEYSLKAGEQIQRVWDAVKYREKNFDEEWMMIVITDHGRTNDGYSHGKQSNRERTTWIATNRNVNMRFKNGEVAHTDINPAVCEFMDLEVPESVRREWDGISFIGKTAIKDLSLYQFEKREVFIRWKAVCKDAPVSIYGVTTNNFRDGGHDKWVKIAEIKAGTQEYKVSLNDLGESQFYKFSVESPHETLNAWLLNR